MDAFCALIYMRVNGLCTREALCSYCNRGVNSLDQQNVFNNNHK